MGWQMQQAQLVCVTVQISTAHLCVTASHCFSCIWDTAVPVTSTRFVLVLRRCRHFEYKLDGLAGTHPLCIQHVV
jgi:hypothetical protein